MSPRSGEPTRTRILDAAQKLVVKHGYAATTLDMVIAAAGITKGAFFYHFDNKAAMAAALLERYAAAHRSFVTQAIDEAERSHRDPVAQLLAMVDAFEAQVMSLLETLDGCPVATFVYEAEGQGSPLMRAARDFFLEDRVSIAKKIREAAARGGVQVDDGAVADMFAVTYEGAAILMRVMGDGAIVTKQFAQFRRYLELLIAPAASPAGSIAQPCGPPSAPAARRSLPKVTAAMYSRRGGRRAPRCRIWARQPGRRVPRP